ncbi:LysR family transcriptional regulator [Ruminococcus sp. OA3]|uniref:LysR family transcriptional regulator n=1 Tax=Ruminococcus TaxID=1263 RepID=UPI001F0518D7|nr:LysR family transcriptional regulator [Ruminococcus sp. OA3]MCH1982332.1 LysR family transcriptional regulator [Ruminococcus sp. OA3]
MDIKQLQYFVTSVDLGSFHAAAEALITTQPNVSKVMKALEEEMGMTLLARNRSGVTLTKEGEQVYRYALSTLKNFEMLNALKGEKEESLIVCCTPSNNLSTLLAEFYGLKSYRKPHLDLREGDFEDIVAWVHRRSTELGFTYISRRNQLVFEGRLKTKGLGFHELARTSIYLFCSEKNPLFDRRYVSEKDLEAVKLIQRREEIHSLSNHLGVLNGDGLSRSGRQEIAYTNSDHFLIQMLKNTDYCSVDSSFLKDKYKEYHIKAIPVRGSENSVSFGYIKRIKDSLTEIADEFIRYLEEQIREER